MRNIKYTVRVGCVDGRDISGTFNSPIEALDYLNKEDHEGACSSLEVEYLNPDEARRFLEIIVAFSR